MTSAQICFDLFLQLRRRSGLHKGFHGYHVGTGRPLATSSIPNIEGFLFDSDAELLKVNAIYTP